MTLTETLHHIEMQLKDFSPSGAWHRHYDVRCEICRELVYPRVTCAFKGDPRSCLIPYVARCLRHFHAD